MNTTPNPSTSTNNNTRRASGPAQAPVEYQTKKGCLTLGIAMVIVTALAVLAIIFANGGAGLHGAG